MDKTSILGLIALCLTLLMCRKILTIVELIRLARKISKKTENQEVSDQKTDENFFEYGKVKNHQITDGNLDFENNKSNKEIIEEIKSKMDTEIQYKTEPKNKKIRA